MECVVTDVGLITAAGDTAQALLYRLIDRSEASPADGAAVPILGFDIRRYVDRKGMRLLSRISQLSCAAASKLEPGLAGVPGSAVGVVLGTAWAGLASIVRFEHEAHVEGPRFVDPILFTETVANVPAGHVSILFGWSALNATVSSGAAAGFEALRLGLDLLAEGRAEVVVAGGCDGMNPYLSCVPDVAGPARAGEGACFLALESRAHAERRGAAILGRLMGAVVVPVPAGDAACAAGAVRGLLERAGLDPREVDALVLTAGDDRAPGTAAAALRDVFGDKGPPSISLPTALGQTWGAAGAIGTALALEMIRGTLAVARFRHVLVVGEPEGGPAAAILVGPRS